MPTFKARRSSMLGWIVAVDGRADARVAVFGQDEARAEALALALNAALAASLDDRPADDQPADERPVMLTREDRTMVGEALIRAITGEVTLVHATAAEDRAAMLAVLTKIDAA